MRVTATGLVENQEKLKALAARIRDLSPVLEVAAADTITLIDDSFDQEVSPDGMPWAPLSPVTIALRLKKERKASLRRARRRRREDILRVESATGRSIDRRSYNRTHGRVTAESDEVLSGNIGILKDTQRLRRSVTANVRAKSFTFGTNVAYAGAHQSGANIKVFGRKSATLQARPFLPVTPSGSGYTLMTGGGAGAHWTRVRAMVRDYILKGEL